MLSRRHLRIKTLQVLYAFFQGSKEKSTVQVERELVRSLDKVHDLYLYFLLVFEELVLIEEQRIADRKQKLTPSAAAVSASERWVHNPIFTHFATNTSLRQQATTKKVNWKGVVKNDLMRKLYAHIRQTELYGDYLKKPTLHFKEHKQFAIALFKTEIANFGLLHAFFEEESIYWLDDIDLVCSMVIKTMTKIVETSTKEDPILPLYKDEADRDVFVQSLLRKSIEEDEANEQLIDALTQNWELDRIAKMDIILLKMALTELKEMTSIPKKVTLNEYIEISKFYSTPKSQVFINGVLDKAVNVLEKKGLLRKSGRGLIN